MKRYTWLLALAALAIGAVAVRAQDTTADAVASDSDVSVRIVGLNISLPRGDDGNDDASTEVSLLATLAGKTIIEVDEDNYTLRAFTDDQGKVLLSPDPDERDFFEGLGTPFGQEIGGDTVEFSFDAEAVPSANATTLTLQATVPVFVGSGDSEIASEGALALGQDFTMGDYTITLSRIGVSQWDDSLVGFSFTSSDGFVPLKAMRFFDAEGNELESELGGSSKSTSNGVSTYEQTFNVEVAVDAAVTLKIEYFTTVETVDVEIDMTFGLGGGAID